MEDGVSTTAIDADGEERFQALRRELGVSAFGLNLIRLRPGQRGRIHRHERQEEVYLVLEGTLTLETDDGEQELTRGRLARVAPAVRRQLSNRGPDTVLIVAIGGGLEHVGRDGRRLHRLGRDEGRPPQEVPLPPDLEV